MSSNVEITETVDVVPVVVVVVVCVVMDGVWVLFDEVVVECIVVVCLIVCDGDGVVRVEFVIDDSNASARYRVDGGLIFGMLIVMGTEIRARLLSQYFGLRDNHMA